VQMPVNRTTSSSVKIFWLHLIRTIGFGSAFHDDTLKLTGA
jgi:hypothetical protein